MAVPFFHWLYFKRVPLVGKQHLETGSAGSEATWRKPKGFSCWEVVADVFRNTNPDPDSCRDLCSERQPGAGLFDQRNPDCSGLCQTSDSDSKRTTSVCTGISIPWLPLCRAFILGLEHVPKQQRRKPWLKGRVSVLWAVTHGECRINTDVQPKRLPQKEECLHSEVSRSKVFVHRRMNQFMRFVLLFKSPLSQTHQELQHTEKKCAQLSHSTVTKTLLATEELWLAFSSVKNTLPRRQSEQSRRAVTCHWFLSGEKELFNSNLFFWQLLSRFNSGLLKNWEYIWKSESVSEKVLTGGQKRVKNASRAQIHPAF